MFIVAKVNKWSEFVLLDGTVHANRQAAADHLDGKVAQLGEAVAADYRVFSLTEQR